MRWPRWAWPHALQEPEDEEACSAWRSAEADLLGSGSQAVEGKRPIGAGVLPYRGIAGLGLLFWRRRLTQGRPNSSAPRGGLRGPDAASGSRPRTRSAPPASRSPRPGCRLAPGATPAFLPVQVATPAAAEATCGLEIVLTHGRSVRVRAGFDRQTLAEVLAVLETRPC